MMIMNTVIVISGLPCTGKTSVGRHLAERYGLPFIHKDGIKETLFDTLGWRDRSWSKQLSGASYALLFHFISTLLAGECSFICEANFNAEQHTTKFQILQQKHGFQVIQIQCVCEGTVLWQRFQQRAESDERHPGHVDEQTYQELRPSLLWGCSEPLAIPGEVLKLDTTDFSSIDYERLYADIETVMVGWA